MWTRWLTFIYLPTFNLQLLLVPSRLSFDWSMEAIPLVGSFCDTRVWQAVFSYAILGLIFIKAANGQLNKQRDSYNKGNLVSNSEHST